MKRFFSYPIRSFLLAGITWLLILLAKDILGFGNYTLLHGDLYVQYIDFISQFLRVLRGKEDFWYSFSVYLGSGTALNHAYYCLSPLNLLYLIDFIPIPTMTAVIIGLKFSLAAFTFTIFAEKVFRRSEWYICLFAVFYAFNSFSLSFYFNMIWLDALYLLPILVLLLFELADHGRFIGLTVCWVLLFITNFYLAYTLGIFSVLCFFFILFLRTEHFDRSTLQRYLRRSALFALSVLLAAGICAVLLLPAGMLLFSSSAADNYDFRELKATLPDILNSMFMGIMPFVDNDTPLLYCGLPCLLLLPFYYTCKGISKKEKILSLILQLFFITGMLFLPAFMLLHAFDFPNWYNFRFSYIFCFISCALACRRYGLKSPIRLRHLLAYSIGLIFFFSFMIGFWPLQTTDLDITSGPVELALNSIFLLLWSCFLSLDPASPVFVKKQRTYKVGACIMLLSEITISSALCLGHLGRLALTEEEYNQWYNAEKNAIETILSEDHGLYRISVISENNDNAPAMFGYNGFNSFSSSDVYNVRNALHHLGVGTMNRAMYEYGYTPPVYMLFSRKYTVTLPSAGSADNNPSITKEELSLPFGYMVSENIYQYTPGENPFTNQEQLLSLMTNTECHLYEAIAPEQLSVVSLNMQMDLSEDGYHFRRSSTLCPDALIRFSADNLNDQDFYIAFTREHAEGLAASADVLSAGNGYESTPMLSLGCIHKGLFSPENAGQQAVAISFNSEILSDYCDNILPVRYDPQSLLPIHDYLSQRVWDPEMDVHTILRGTVTATDDRCILFTGIPYENGWLAFVDDNPVPIHPAIEHAFIALELTSGIHEITLQYIAPGSKTGALISVFSIVTFIIISILHTIHHPSKH